MALELGMVEAFCGVSRQAARIYEVRKKIDVASAANTN
jgi:hypothetical protein